MLKIPALLFCILSFNFLFAQSNEFRVEEIIVKGELTQDDAYDPNFGRFDGVELYLTKGDIINISLVSEFPPFLALVTPSEKYFVEYSQDGASIINYLKTIDESGTWFLSIAGDSTDSGSYELVINYMSENSKTLSRNTDFCTSLNFISEHSKTDFFFLIRSAKEGEIDLWEPKVKLKESINSNIAQLENNDTWYFATMFEGNDKDSIETKYNELTEVVENCLGPDWVSISKEWVKTVDRKGELKKGYRFALKEKTQTKLVSVNMVDRGKKDNANFRYAIEIEAKRKNRDGY